MTTDLPQADHKSVHGRSTRQAALNDGPNCALRGVRHTNWNGRLRPRLTWDANRSALTAGRRGRTCAERCCRAPWAARQWSTCSVPEVDAGRALGYLGEADWALVPGRSPEAGRVFPLPLLTDWWGHGDVGELADTSKRSTCSGRLSCAISGADTYELIARPSPLPRNVLTWTATGRRPGLDWSVLPFFRLRLRGIVRTVYVALNQCNTDSRVRLGRHRTSGACR
jgi:hypothetical protein